MKSGSQIFGSAHLFVLLNIEGDYMENLSTKIRRIVGAKSPPNEQRLMRWYEHALDLENACRYWEKAAELRRSKSRRRPRAA